MSTLTLEATPQLDGDRGVDAKAATPREASSRGGWASLRSKLPIPSLPHSSTPFLTE
jgi:hypothetical protein